MVFSSTVFLFLFFPLTLIIYYNPFIKSRNFKNRFLLLASLVFYAWGEPLFVFLMLLSVAVGWQVGLRIEAATIPRERKRWLIAGATFHLGLLFIFKYLTFTAQELGLLLGRDFSHISLALPIGISFFTFQLLSYIFDIYRRQAQAQKSILDTGLYIALFPQLIAGPIVRYDTIEGQIKNRRETLTAFSDGMLLFIYGLGKKVLIANYMAQIADNIFGDRGELAVATAWLGAVAYTLQIYFDFSGYSDMAIGLGKMFGFKFPENFNYPYIANNATEFWRRWHISLGSWFRDYVYIPLGGNRVKKSRWVLNLFCVWALTGLWHGANWTFLAWGLFYFVLLLAERLTDFPTRIGPLAHVYALVAIIIGWTMFRSENIGAGLCYIGTMFGLNANTLTDEVTYYYLTNAAAVFIAGIALSLPLLPTLEKSLKGTLVWETAEPLLALGIFLLSLIVTVSGSYNPFIYFNF